MSSFKDKTVLITGGANGIGKMLGEKALRAGAKHLVIWDVDEAGMQQIQNSLATQNQSVYTFQVDLGNAEEIYDKAQIVKEKVSPVDILFNNAGIVHGGWFHEQVPEHINKTIHINTLAAMHVARAFLPDMVKQDAGHIINISSAASLIANPQMATYAASKWALTGWSESLRLEMEQGGHSIRVTTIQPGYISTGMFAGVKAPRLTPFLSPEKITDAIIHAVQKDKVILRKPFMVKLIPFLKGMMPTRIFDFIAGKLFKVYTSMHSFNSKK